MRWPIFSTHGGTSGTIDKAIRPHEVSIFIFGAYFYSAWQEDVTIVSHCDGAQNIIETDLDLLANRNRATTWLCCCESSNVKMNRVALWDLIFNDLEPRAYFMSNLSLTRLLRKCSCNTEDWHGWLKNDLGLWESFKFCSQLGGAFHKKTLQRTVNPAH